MEEVLKPDLCVIGAGSGGLAVAAAAAQLGVPVVLIEKGRMGGNSLNYGCVPSKALLAAGKRAEAVRTASNFGIDVIEAQIDHRGVHDHVHGAIAAIAPNDSIERFTGLGVRVIQANASFLDKFTVEAGRVLVRARRFVIATGSVPVVPLIPGLDEVPYFTNETIFDVSERIQHLIVLGGGSTGLELAQAHRMLGSHVTVFDTGDMLAEEDREARSVIFKRFEDTQLMLFPKTRVERVERSVQGVAAHFNKDGETVLAKATHMLVATGRKPNVKGLSLDRAGVAFTEEGIKVNDQLRTSNRRIYAVGDVIGTPEYAHLAEFQAGVVIRNAIFRLKPDANAVYVPRVLYTDPELAQVGLTEAMAKERGLDLAALTFEYGENDRARAERQTEGFATALVDAKGRIFGATIVGAHAGELIGLWGLAIGQGIKIGAVAQMIAPYPTLSEVSKRAAGSFYTPKLFSDRTRKVVRLLGRLG